MSESMSLWIVRVGKNKRTSCIAVYFDFYGAFGSFETRSIFNKRGISVAYFILCKDNHLY